MKSVALVGLGMVADTHLAALRESATVELVGVTGRDAAKTRAFATKATQATGSDVTAYTSIDELANDARVDFVILATPPDARRDIVASLAAAGKPILLEKPIERNLPAAREIVAICSKAQVPLGIVFQHRARAASCALKTAITKGLLGDIAAAELRVPWWRDQSYYDAPGRGTYARDGGGVLITQAIHTIDLALWFLGPFISVQALLRRTPLHELEAEDWAGGLFETARGAVGTMLATTAAYPGAAECITLQGTKASAHLEAGVLRLSFQDGRTETHGNDCATGGGADPMAFTHDWHQSVIEDFADCLDTGKSPLADGASALLAHCVIDALERSSRNGQRTEVAAHDD